MKKERKQRSLLFIILKGIGAALLAVVVLAVGLVGCLSVAEYKPADVEAIVP